MKKSNWTRKIRQPNLVDNPRIGEAHKETPKPTYFLDTVHMSKKCYFIDLDLAGERAIIGIEIKEGQQRIRLRVPKHNRGELSSAQAREVATRLIQLANEIDYGCPQDSWK